jgi:type I restriction enzyme S subunit
MRPYPKYKDSGVEWIGQVPEHWEMRKVSRSFNLIKSGTTPSSDINIYYENGDINWIQSGDLNDGYLSETKKQITNVALKDNTALQVYPKGSLVIAMYGATIGKLGIMNFDGCCNQACCVLNNSKFFIIKYIFYWFLANKINIIQMSFGGGQPNISQDIIRNIKIPCSELNEQNLAIVFLDKKILLIDELIAKKERMIELLKEQRATVINEAVTKGLNPNVKMQDSGVEWIGKVPEHWEVKKLKHTTYIKGRVGWQALTTNEYIDEGPYLITGTDFIDGQISWKTCFHVSEERYLMDAFIQVKNGDTLITKDGTIGKVAVITNMVGKATLNSGVFLIRPLRENTYISEFMYWLLNSMIFFQFIEYTKKGSTISHLYQEVFREFIYPLPDTKEQNKIVDYIGIQNKEFLGLIEKEEKEIELLMEYRISLISEVVTGKIRVE